MKKKDLKMSYVFSKLLQTNVNYVKNVEWYRLQYALKNISLPTASGANTTPETLEVLHKCKHFLIVNKPYNLVMYRYGKNASPGETTLLEIVRDKFPMYFDPRITGGFHILHRLDSVTSGCVCIPLTYFSQRLAVEAFRNGDANKQYLSLVHGRLNETIADFSGVKLGSDGSFIINKPIGEDLRRLKYSRCTTTDKHANRLDYCIHPQNSITRVKVLEYGTYKGQDCTKVLVEPVTGKRHQIRVHMAYVGHEIVGDTCYGRGDFDSYRTMLHAYKLQIRINTKQRMFLKAIAPDPFVSSVDPDWRPEAVVNKS
jgi:23S rRNA-/tRNA-specific pseudouridylate synthase